ncbi:MAG: hypothetical protein Q8M40_04810 [Legionella sp.]|nr:hypothetical protein [Legionella sp.]
MFFKLHIPRLVPSTYEGLIPQKLSEPDTYKLAVETHQSLRILRKQIITFSDDITQILSLNRDYNFTKNIRVLERCLEESIKLIIDNKPLPVILKNSLINSLGTLKDDDMFHTSRLLWSSLNLLNQSMLALSAAYVFSISALAIGAMPIFLGLGVVLGTALIMGIAAYSAYVELRFMGNMQIKSITQCVEAVVKFDQVQNKNVKTSENECTPYPVNASA